MGGSAAYLAAVDVREKMLRIAGSILEVAAADLVATDGHIFVKGSPDRTVTIEEVASQAYRHTHGQHMDEVEPALESTRHFKIGNVYHQPEKQGRFSTYPTWPYGVAAMVVEVDPETGLVKVLRYVLVHDAGTIINPLLVEANLHGAMTQGIGSAMYEEIAYDESGQPQTATFMDYTIPTAVDVPNYELGHLFSPSPFTPLGAKGVGESGIGAVLGSLCSAIEDALPHLDLHLTRLPLTPSRVWEEIRNAPRRKQAAAG
jgi:carbon-monoxide dehydrogenase large subunit